MVSRMISASRPGIEVRGLRAVIAGVGVELRLSKMVRDARRGVVGWELVLETRDGVERLRVYPGGEIRIVLGGKSYPVLRAERGRGGRVRIVYAKEGGARAREVALEKPALEKTVYSDGRITLTRKELRELAESPSIAGKAERGEGGGVLVALRLEGLGELVTELPRPENRKNYRFKVSLLGARPGQKVTVTGVREVKTEDLLPLEARLESGSLSVERPGEIVVCGRRLKAETRPAYIPNTQEKGVEAEVAGETIRILDSGRAAIRVSGKFRNIVAAEASRDQVAITYATPAGRRTRLIKIG